MILAAFSFPAVVAAQDQCSGLDPTIQALLESMSSSALTIDYRGVVTLQRGGDMQILEMSHRVVNGAQTETVTRLTGQDASVRRTRRSGNCIGSANDPLGSGQCAVSSVCELADVYRFRVSKGEMVAGRDAIRLRAEPLDMYRFGYVFELDRETALTLKSTTLSADQRVLEQFQFASLQMVARSSDSPNAGQGASRQSATEPMDASSDAPMPNRMGPKWEPSWVPEGFAATSETPMESQRKSYTDGLSSFSVFIEPLTVPINPGEGVEREGSTVAYTRCIEANQNPVLVTVVGEIPTNTARMVADSVRMR